jgi:hypothetical protein
LYAQEIINQNLSSIKPSYIWQDKRVYFDLKEYSKDEILQRVDALNNYIKLDVYEETKKESAKKVRIELKNPNNPIPPTALEFIANERIMSQLNCWHFLENYYYISDVTNRFILYSPTKPQLIWKHINAKMESQGRAIRELRGKARQTTSSTDAIGKILHRDMFYPDIKSALASYKDDASWKLGNMYMDAYDRLPFWLKPLKSKYHEGDFYLFENNSILYIAAGTTETLTTGTTPTVSLCSEISRYKYPEQSIEASLLKSMHETKYLFQIFESTANGNDDDNYFKQKWEETIIGMEKGTSSLYASFIPWVLRDDIYPTREYILGRSKAFNNYKPSIETLAYAKKVEQYIRSNPDITKVIGSNWHMPIEQMFYYETERAAAEKNNTLWIFLQEMPATPEEMFQNSGKTVYSIQTIEYYNNKCYEKTPEVYKLKGDATEIDPAFWPTSDEIKENGKRIIIKPRYIDECRSDYELVECNFNGWDKFDYKNKILIWEHPRLDSTYGLGIDNNEGLGEKVSDDSVIEILRKGTIREKDAQVAEIASPDLNPNRLWPYALALGTYYSPKEQSLIANELNNGGVELQNNLIQRGWGNFPKIYNSEDMGKDISEVKRYGVHTNNRTRPLYQNKFNDFLFGKWLEFYSLKLLEELKNLKAKPRLDGTIKFSGTRDNRFMAMAIVVYHLHELEIMGYQKASWESRIKEESQVMNFKSYNQYSYEKKVFSIDNIKDGTFEYENDDEFGSEEIEML